MIHARRWGSRTASSSKSCYGFHQFARIKDMASMSVTRGSRFQIKRHLRRVYRRAVKPWLDRVRGRKASALSETQALSPLMFATKTYNTAHPNYEPELVQNFPNRIFNADLPSNNSLFREIKKLAFAGRVPTFTLRRVLKQAMEEASTVAGFAQVMERIGFIEDYMAALGRRYEAHYIPGWVNLVDAQFLYWAVRQAKPEIIVQTGVSNGLSSAFMMLALARNGPTGKLHVIDIPAIFDPADPAWTQKGAVYGVVIPEGKSSGWIVPDIYRDRFNVQVGDAKILLPKLVDTMDRIDMFFHDSDHTYHHMMFEFEQAMRKLVPGGVILADDIAWNASLWDFADARRVPTYNYRGTVGAAFF
jgi:predicted O-methyltransferase YrrM